MTIPTKQKTPRNLRVAIIAMKQLTNNTRIVRQATVLANSGHDVTVIARKKPDPSVIKNNPMINWHEINGLNFIQSLFKKKLLLMAGCTK